MAKTGTIARKTETKTAHTARKVASNPWVERLTRLGYLVRGVVYIGLGILAIQTILGRASNSLSPNGVIQSIGANPYGKVMLIVVALGLVGYTLWGFIRAVFDPLHRGDDAEGIVARLGFVASALGYGTLLVFTVQYLLGATLTASNPQDWSEKLLAQPFGRGLVGFIGLCWLVGGGLWQIYDGLKGNFIKDLKTRKMSRNERDLIVAAGRIGLPARGVVFGLIGLFLIQSAIQANPNKAKGFDGALLAVVQQPYGPILLGIVAAGLIAFGVYSILDAIWMRVEVRGTS